MNENEKFYKPSDVAEKLQISEQTIYKHIKLGKLKAVKVGNRYLRVSQSSLSEYLGESTESITTSSVDKTPHQTEVITNPSNQL